VIGTIFLPSIFYVGDQVEARITIRTRDEVSLVPPETMPKVAWAVFDSIATIERDDGWDVRVVFTPFEPGTHTLPPIDLGGVSVSGIDIHVRSILQDPLVELSPPRPQLLLPSTRLMFGIAGAVVVFLPLAWFTFVRWGRKQVRRLVLWYRRGKPYRNLSKQLRGLNAEVDSEDGRAFYRDMMVEMRKYLSQKLRRDCMSATTSELEEFLKPVVSSPESRKEIVSVFRAGDLVKFAGRSSTPSERRNHIDLLDRAASEIEAEQRRERNVGR
jgi:hypothetical protein